MMELPFWMFAVMNFGAFMIGFGLATVLFQQWFENTNFGERVQVLNKVAEQRKQLFEQLERNQVFLDSLAFKDQRAVQLLQGNQRTLGKIHESNPFNTLKEQ